MHATLPLLSETGFPALRRAQLETLQVNLGYVCNQSCLHCHVSAGPKRTESMTAETAALVGRLMADSGVGTLDLTGGAPEMNPHFRSLVLQARERGIRVIDRCNLTILEEPGYEGLADFLADNQVDIVASLPCYLEDNVDAQRGMGVYDASVRGIARLNALGYGHEGSGLRLDLVYNPQGPSLPPPQQALEVDYRRVLGESFGLVFNNLLTLANMPVGRFGSVLVSKGQFNDYMQVLRGAHRDENVSGVMCRSTLSIDWQGYVYDCDFNQMLGLPLPLRPEQPEDGISPRVHLSEVLDADLRGRPIAVRDHCYGCTAGQGSSCGGALS